MSILSTVSLRIADAHDVQYIVSWSYDGDFAMTVTRGSGYQQQEREKFLAKKMVALAQTNASQKLFMIESATFGPIGVIGFVDIDWKNQNLVMEDHIDRRFRGAPVLKRIFNLACDYAFDDLNMRKILFYIHGTNERALKLARYGDPDKPEAVLKNYIRTAEGLMDLYVYSYFRADRDEIKHIRENRETYIGIAEKMANAGYLGSETVHQLRESDEPEQWQQLRQAINAFRREHNLPYCHHLTSRDIAAIACNSDGEHQE